MNVHAAIIYKAPLNVIKITVDYLHGRNLTVLDSRSRRPLNVAIEEGVHWDEGLGDIIQKFAHVQTKGVLYVAAEHGLQWTNHMEQVVQLYLNRELLMM